MQISYYEIYKEKIYDLLASTTTKNKTRVCVCIHYVAQKVIHLSINVYVCIGCCRQCIKQYNFTCSYV